MKYYYADCTDYGEKTHHNLGDFVYTIALDNFIKMHNVDCSTVRKDLVSSFKFGEYDMLIMAGFFPGINKTISVDRSCRNVKFIGFHYSGKMNPGITPNDYIGNFGCRDFGTFRTFKDGNPNCYVSLCASLMCNLIEFPDLDVKADKTIFVDCPKDVVKRHWNSRSVSMTHWVPHHDRGNPEMCNAAKTRLRYYKERAKMVYTTKLHVYLPCVAMGVPVKYIGVKNYRTEIVNVVNADTIKTLQPLVIQNFEHEIFGNGPDVHLELHETCMELLKGKRQ